MRCNPVVRKRGRKIEGLERLILRIVVFGSGAVLMALEMLAFRIMAVTFGSALYQTTAVIAVFLTAMSVGYYLGGKIGDRWPHPQTLALAMGASGIFIVLVPALNDAVSGRVFESSFPEKYHALIAASVIFSGSALLLATVSPIAIRLGTRAVEDTGKVAGTVAALSTIGSIAGTVLTGFYLIDLFGSYRRLVYCLGVVMFLLAVMMSAISGVAAVVRRRSHVVAVGVLLLLGALPARAQNVVFERDSAFHHVVVRDEGTKRILYFDNAPQSQMDRDDPVSGGFEYTDFFHMAFLFNPDIKDVLFLGLGGGSAPKRFLYDYPQVRGDAVDVDPLVIEVAQKYFGVKPGPRLRLIEGDARVYVKRTTKTYDLIILDAYTSSRYGSTIPHHLTTREFFREVARCLRPGGVIAYNVTGEVEGWGSAITRALLKTITTEFTSPYLFQAESSRNTVILAFKGATHKLSQSDVVRRAQELVKQGKVKLPEFVRRASRMVPVPNVNDAVLLTDDYAPVDRLMRE